jgi:hypothetical protein
MSMKNFIDTIGNRTRDLPAYNTVPQPTNKTKTILHHLAQLLSLENTQIDVNIVLQVSPVFSHEALIRQGYQKC